MPRVPDMHGLYSHKIPDQTSSKPGVIPYCICHLNRGFLALKKLHHILCARARASALSFEYLPTPEYRGHS
jgi:hypothetical protein